MKRLILLTFSFFLISIKVLAVTYNSEPKIFINELVNDAIKTLGDKNLTQEEKNTLIEKIAKDNVDIKALGLYTLGGLRETIEKETLVKYHNLFEKYFLKSLTSRLSDYTSEKFEVINSDKKMQNIQLSIQGLLKVKISLK